MPLFPGSSRYTFSEKTTSSIFFLVALTDIKWQMHLNCTLANSPLPRIKPVSQSLVLSLPLSQWLVLTSFPCHVARMHVCSLSISFSRAPLISLCSRMWAERAASPTLKITTSVWQGGGGAGKGCGVCMYVCVWGGGAHRHNTKPTFLQLQQGKRGVVGEKSRHLIFSANPQQKMLRACHSNYRIPFPFLCTGNLTNTFTCAQFKWS